MKTALNIILILNTIYVLICSENTDPLVFAYPLFIYVVAGFFRIYHKEFVEFFNEEPS